MIVRIRVMHPLLIGVLLPLFFLHSGASGAELVREFVSENARQGVAVDADHLYVINNHCIEKRRKSDFELLATWQCPKGEPLIHVNAGFVWEGRLYGAHSNYPEVPMESSVEIWDVATLEHVGSISLGIGMGSITWISRHEDQWWVGFAHYTGKGGEPDKTNAWTQVVVFDDQWKNTRGYTLPKAVLETFGTRSNSGGDWGPDGRLYLSGHDAAELYAMRLPEGGSKLLLDEVIPVPFEGQAFTFDRQNPYHLYGIIRGKLQVVEVLLK